jgi:hypothetical protein
MQLSKGLVGMIPQDNLSLDSVPSHLRLQAMDAFRTGDAERFLSGLSDHLKNRQTC